jgi:hypothetical protein
MVGIVVVTRAGLLIARRASTWTVDEHLGGRSPKCVAVDLRNPAQVYSGTRGAGLFRSSDSGRNWEPVGASTTRWSHAGRSWKALDIPSAPSTESSNEGN